MARREGTESRRVEQRVWRKRSRARTRSSGSIYADSKRERGRARGGTGEEPVDAHHILESVGRADGSTTWSAVKTAALERRTCSLCVT